MRSVPLSWALFLFVYSFLAKNFTIGCIYGFMRRLQLISLINMLLASKRFS